MRIKTGLTGLTVGGLRRCPGALARTRRMPTAGSNEPRNLSSGQTKQNAIKRNAQLRIVAQRDRFAAQLNPVLNEERRRAILDLLTHQGRVLVTELARQFETSQVTIRKDLEILHAHGLVHRTHGGALPSREGALEDPTLREKEKLHHQEKLRIADSAAQKVKEGQVLILDSGTTTTAIARSPAQFQEPDDHHECREHRRRTWRGPQSK